MPQSQCFEIKDGLYGKGVFATRDIKENELIFQETPIVSSHIGNGLELPILACHQCHRFLGPLSTQVDLVSGYAFPDGEYKSPEIVSKFAPSLNAPVPCRKCDGKAQDCPLVYCSDECEQLSWDTHHSIICKQAWNSNDSVEYFEIPKATHYFDEQGNRLIMFREIERFLAENLN